MNAKKWFLSLAVLLASMIVSNPLHAACTADFYANKTSGCAPLTVIFTDNSVGAAKWAWTFSGGTPSVASGKGPHTVVYDTPGVYSVTLKIQCKEGDAAITKPQYITVYDCECKADFEGKPTTGCAPLKVVFTNESTNATDWNWTFDGGIPASATGKGPHTIIYGTAGSYDVKLVIKCPNGYDTEVKSKYINVKNCPCEADFGAKPSSGCAPLTVYYTDMSDGATSWTWHFPGGVPNTATGAGPHIVKYNAPGSYDAELDIICANGAAIEKKAKFITVRDCEVLADFACSPKEGCAPLTVTFTDESQNASSWKWHFPGGQPSSADGQGPHEVVYADSGSYEVTLEVSSQLGSHILKRPDEVTVFPCFYDYGDAPESSLAYPSLGVIGKFPTCRYSGPSGYIRHGKKKDCFFGYQVDHEQEGNEGGCFSIGTTSWDQDESCRERDAGLYKPNAFALSRPADSAMVVSLCYDAPGTAIGYTCGLARWGRSIDIWYQSNYPEGAYINVLIDWNQDGLWGGASTCSEPSSASAPEHVLANFHVPGACNGLLSAWADPPDFRIGPNSGYVWVRFTITPGPISTPWDGSGAFEDGESEDYLLKVMSRSGLMDWGDAPRPYPTWLADGGAYAFVDTSIYIGSGIDDEEDGKPDSTAQGDNTNGQEDGIIFLDELVPGNTACVEITTSAAGYLKLWIDFNRDGDWSDPNDLAADEPANPGKNLLCFPIPQDAEEGITYARCRYSTTIIESFIGGGGFGEIEDMQVTIELPDVPPPLFEYGDAPEGTLAYPAWSCENLETAVMGNFPSCRSLDFGEYPVRTAAGYVVHGIAGQCYFGRSVDYEEDANGGSDGDETMYDDDAGLRGTHTYTIEDNRILSTHGSGEWPLLACETGVWGRSFDMYYNVDREEGAYVNVLIDWDHNGEWCAGFTINYCDDHSTAHEQILRDFFVPRGRGYLSALDPPDFKIGARAGYAWARFTISDTPLDEGWISRGFTDEGWSGYGIFRDGETEDYLLYVAHEDYEEWGDAPDGQIAYPSTGVDGHFPTCGSVDGIHHGNGFGVSSMFLGASLCIPSLETNGNRGACWGLPNTDDDNGIQLLLPYTFKGRFDSLVTVAEFDDSRFSRYRLGEVCKTARWGRNIDLIWTNMYAGEDAYVNVLFDWNQDGVWGGSSDCGDGVSAPEHVLVNHRLRSAYAGSGLGVGAYEAPPDFAIGPNSGLVWARCTITPVPVELPWDGSGAFSDGETEDYLFRVSASIPLCDYGDISWGALNSYARHRLVAGFCLGDIVDDEDDPLNDPESKGDDNDNLNDEDGVTFVTPLQQAKEATILVKASAAGILNAWFDFNGDQDWSDSDEHVFKDVQLLQGENMLTFRVPDVASVEKIGVRFRFSDHGGLSYCDPIPQEGEQIDPPVGEVEDYFVLILTTGVDETSQQIDFELAQNYPNPFNPSTTINFSLPKKTNVRLEIFNVRGQRIRTLANAIKLPGHHTLDWDGRTDQGMMAPTGVYLYKITTEGLVKTKKLLLLK